MTRELSPQQRRVMRLLASGMRNKEIAFEMGVSVTTVRSYVREAMRKMGMTNRIAAVVTYVLVEQHITNDGETIVR